LYFSNSQVCSCFGSHQTGNTFCMKGVHQVWTVPSSCANHPGLLSI
jgi:hypothetical protein